MQKNTFVLFSRVLCTYISGNKKERSLCEFQ